MTNQEIAQEINNRIGNSPVPFDSVYSIALNIYQELGGEESQFDSVYSILLETLNVIDSGISAKVIDDSSISLTKTWSSSKIASELADAGFNVEIVTELPSVGDPHTIYFILKSDSSTGDYYDEWMYIDGNWEMVGNTQIDLSNYATIDYVDEQIEAVIGAANSEIEGKQTEDFTFVVELPASGEEDEQVIIKGDNTDTLYKYVSGAWVEQTPDANKLYFDVENEALYSYVTAQHQFAPVSLVNTIVVGSNLNNNADLKSLKTPGVYSVVQRLHNATKGDYVKNWTLYVESVDYEEYDRSDSVYQRLVSNYTIQKRTWSATRVTNDGWNSFSTYYAGEIKDSTTSKYYTWSSSKINSSLSEIDEKIENVKPIIDASVLPDASENKNKLFRLASDDNVYVSELKSRTSTTTNRLPDAQQIDKAYLESDGSILYYKGDIEVICSDGSLNMYKWDYEDGTYIVTLKNAVELAQEDNCGYVGEDEGWTISGNTATNLSITIDEFMEGMDVLGVWPAKFIPAIYNAPESAQIGNAYITDSANVNTGIYNGTLVTFEDTQGSGEDVTGYKWTINESYIATSKPASEIYFYYDEDNDVYYTDTNVWNVWYDIDSQKWKSEIVNIHPGNDSLYIPQLNAPETNQIENAYYESDGETYVYKGEIIGHFLNNTTLTLYQWYNPNMIEYTITPASNIFGKVYSSTEDILGLYYDSESDMYVSTDYTAEDALSRFYKIDGFNTVKYQRTETTEEWDWQPLTDNATNDDIDAMFDAPTGNTITLIREQDSEQQAEGFIDLLVNTDSETMKYEGNTYYKWVQWANETDTTQPAVEKPNIVVLTNTLDITLPFNYESPEFEYYIRFNNEEWNIMTSQLHGDYTQKTVQ